ncbi:MAG TPA: carboxypeptidase regulatory-like domain-containing protein [Longimicrobiaceae bacterium]|nr:carboxypeptidase regulatory-like domain-containing protein [Longimicrobiaceae bacterium]
MRPRVHPNAANRHVDLPTPEAAVGRAELRGQLLDAESGEPVQGAVVRLQGQGGGRTTDRQGRFVLPGVRPDRYTLEVEHLAYGKQAEMLAIGGGGVVEVELRLSQHAIEIPGLQVEVIAAREMMRRRSGTRLDLFTREDIEELARAAHHVGDLTRRFPGVRVREILHPGGTRSWLCIESSRTIRDPNNPDPGAICHSVKVYLDDMWIPDGPEFLVGLPLQQLESVQFIPGLVAQARYGRGAENGVLLIYTRGNGPTASNLR